MYIHYIYINVHTFLLQCTYRGYDIEYINIIGMRFINVFPTKQFIFYCIYYVYGFLIHRTSTGYEMYMQTLQEKYPLHIGSIYTCT